MRPRSRTPAPGEIDVYFDNVGGPVLEAVLRRINRGAPIPLVGLIAQSNAAEPPPGPNLMPLLIQRALIQGFIVSDHPRREANFLRDVSGWLKGGKIRYKENVVEGLENAPRAFLGLFRGENFGKLLVRVGDDPTRARGGTDMGHEDQLRAHLLDLLGGGHAHLNFDQAVAGLPPELRGAKPPGVPHTPWRLLEHLRIAQGDILRFCIDPMHVSPEFPAGYWPAGDAPPDPGAWDRTVAAFRADLKAMRDLVADPATDLFAPLPHGQGQTVLREALLVADHNAYHLGQLVTIRRLLGAWHEGG